MKQRVSNLIPKGKGQNIAEFYKNGSKTEGLFARYAKEGGHKHSMVKCACCSRLVPGVIIESYIHECPPLDGIICEIRNGEVIPSGDPNRPLKDPVPLHMPCRVCEKWLGHLELDNRQVLDGMCLDCFEEEIQ